MKADGEVIYTATDMGSGCSRRARRRPPAAEGARRHEDRCGRRHPALAVQLRSSARLQARCVDDERGMHETRRRHRHGHRVLDRQHDAGGAGLAARGADPASPAAEKYAELGFRCQVHGEPQARLGGAGAAQAEALHERRHGLELHRHGSGDPRCRPRAEGRRQRAHRHHHGLGRPLDASPSSLPPRRRATQAGPKKIGPFEVPKAMCSGPSGVLATAFQIKGTNYSISSACATSRPLHRQCRRADPVGQAGRDVRRRLRGARLDAVRTCSTPWAPCRRGSTRRPAKASRAYDKNRDGFVIAGGAGVVVLEELERAKARGAKIYGEVVGYGATSDGFDMVAPSGEGAVRCMRMALQGLRRQGRRAGSTTSIRTAPARRSATPRRSRPSARCSAATCRRSPRPSR